MDDKCAVALLMFFCCLYGFAFGQSEWWERHRDMTIGDMLRMIRSRLK